MKDIIEHIEAGGATYPLVFNLNVMESIQSEYGSVGDWGSAMTGTSEPIIKDVKFGIREMINEGIDIENEDAPAPRSPLTDKQVGRLISEIGIAGIVETIKKITVKSTDTGENSKNA